VELFTDQMCAGGASHRCGNCFEPFFAGDVERANEMHDALTRHDSDRAAIVAKYARRT
jgi:hypothetical protein